MLVLVLMPGGGRCNPDQGRFLLCSVFCVDPISFLHTHSVSSCLGICFTLFYYYFPFFYTHTLSLSSSLLSLSLLPSFSLSGLVCVCKFSGFFFSLAYILLLTFLGFFFPSALSHKISHIGVQRGGPTVTVTYQTTTDKPNNRTQPRR